jgi:hypothetical protein
MGDVTTSDDQIILNVSWLVTQQVGRSLTTTKISTTSSSFDQKELISFAFDFRFRIKSSFLCVTFIIHLNELTWTIFLSLHEPIDG